MMFNQDNDNRDNEIFKDIPGYEGDYQVSNQGRIKSFKRYPQGKILCLKKDMCGYRQIGLSRNNKSKSVTVHSLVILAFVGKGPDGMDINHIDGDKTNNHVDNLEYCTHHKNMRHAIKSGLLDNSGENHGQSKLTETQVLEIRARYEAGGIFQRELAKEYGVGYTTINYIVNRKNWKHI